MENRLKRFYFAARLDRKDELLEYARQLEENFIGVCCSSWLYRTYTLDNGATADQARFIAQADLDDLDSADTVVVFTELPTVGYNKGGRHVELGYALARRKMCEGWDGTYTPNIVVIGPHENTFTYILDHQPSWGAFMLSQLDVPRSKW